MSEPFYNFSQASIHDLLNDFGAPEGALKERVEFLEDSLEKLCSRLSALADSDEFRLGDALLGVVSKKNQPSVFRQVARYPDDEQRGRALLLEIEQCERLIHMVENGMRIRLGRRMLELRQNPWRFVPIALNLSMISSRLLIRRAMDRISHGIAGVNLAGINGPLNRWCNQVQTRKILLYAQVDPNLIDGASTWLASLAEMLLREPDVRLTVLLGKRLRRGQVLAHLMDHPRALWVEAHESPEGKSRILSPVAALRALLKLDRACRQDVVILRGPGPVHGVHLLEAASIVGSLASRTFGYVVDPACWMIPTGRSRLKWVNKRLAGLILQTIEAREFVQEFLDEPRVSLSPVLPPMIRDVASSAHELDLHRPPKLVYAGKFSPPYMVLEMVLAMDSIRERFPGAKLHVVGDKFHNRPRTEGFEQRLRKALCRPGIVWHGGLSRAKTRQIISECDLALSWRGPSFDQSLELATKILEYAGLGLPVIMNPTKMHRSLFGDEYAGFISEPSEFVSTVCSLLEDKQRYEAAAKRALYVASWFTFEKTSKSLLDSIFDSK